MNYFILTFKNENSMCSCLSCKQNYKFFTGRFYTIEKKTQLSCSYDNIIANSISLNIKTHKGITSEKDSYAFCLYRYNINSIIYKLIIL